MSERYPDVPIWAGGMSFGSWIAMTAGAEDARVSLLLGIAPPVDRYDFDALKTCTLPKFIIHGEADELISIKDVRKFYSQLPEPKELVTIEDANHLFEGKTSMVGDAVEDLLADFNTVKT
jgi:alpha/beta superfamily hydrolase